MNEEEEEKSMSSAFAFAFAFAFALLLILRICRRRRRRKMIIKRELKTQMIPSLKRCRLSNSVSGSRKSSLGGYYFPLSLLGEISSGIVPGGGRNVFSAPRSHSPSTATEAPRPPLPRTSRGRIRTLPSRFKDSVLDNWRKDGKNVSEGEVERCRKEKATSLKSKQLEEARACVVDREREDERVGSYGPENFYSGDLVWAKPGRSEPFWPAIVIDPLTQAPELVLRSCVPDSACVVFFGHSGNDNERVRRERQTGSPDMDSDCF